MIFPLQASSYKLHVFILLILSFFCFTSDNLFAQPSKQTVKVLGISVEGNVSADARTIIANSGIKKGDEIQVPGDRTISSIKQLWSLNIFSDVQILIERQVPEGAYLLIKVEEYPRIEKIVVEGSDAVSKSDIEEKVNLIRGQILKPQEVQKIKTRVNALYEKDGYFNTEINMKSFSFFSADSSKKEIITRWRNVKNLAEEYELRYEISDNRSKNFNEKVKERLLVKIEIKENDKLTVRKIRFLGNKSIPEADLKATFDETAEKVWWKFWNTARFDTKKYEKDKELLLQFYRKKGYRDAEIVKDSIYYFNEKSDMNLFVFINEGPQFKIRNIIWEGVTIYQEDFLNERLGFKKGDIYDFVTLNQNLRGNEKQNDINSLYLDNGYLTASLKPSEKRVSADSIDIIITVSENNQFKVGDVEIKGNSKTKDKIIRRELFTVPGDFFNKAAMIRSLQQLANLQYFNVEKLYTEGVDYALPNDSTVNVSFKVDEKSSDYLNASIGYSGSFGFSGAIGVTLTNFSILEPFQLGGGQILNFNWQFGVGNLYRTFSLGFTEPWFMDTPTLVGVDFYDTRQKYIYDLSQTGGSIKVGRRLKWPDDYFYVQGVMRYQHNDVLDGGIRYRTGISDQWTLGTTVSRKNVDNPIFPSQGSSMVLTGEISGGPFLPGDVDYFKINFTTEWYKRLFNTNKLALFMSADMGYLQELRDNTPIQPFDYFYMGGSGLVIATTSLRGYDDRTVGPKASNGDVIGGRVVLKFQSELRFAVSLEPMPLYLLAFAEAGNVFESLKQADPFNLRRSVGVGARILINPIGLIGFDLGYGFDKRQVDGKDPSWMFHFQFGKGF